MLATKRQTGFTLVEILIVVVILGILAAIVIPQFTNASEEARANNMLTQLQTVRSQLELYQVQHNGDYPDFAANGWTQLTQRTDLDGTVNAGGGAFGPYLQTEPINPFEDSSDVAGSPTVNGAAAADTGWAWQDGVLHAVMSAADAARMGLDTHGDVVTY
jgi:general secretion pathway protein G